MALMFYALSQGAHILRAHDVKEAQECVKLYQALRDAEGGAEGETKTKKDGGANKNPSRL